MAELPEKIGELYPQIPRDLPADYEGRFCPNSFMPRKFLINTKKWVKPEFRPYILTPPDNVAGYESDGYYRRAVTWDMVMQRRRKRQQIELERKRDNYDVIYKKPLFVWVFWCPGISGIFRGWWAYLKGYDDDYHADELLEQVIKLFPLVEIDLFGKFNLDLWMKRFVKKYKRGTWCGKPQGLSPVWTLVQGHYVQKILCRA